MIVWGCLLLASLLSCAGQLCQKQATRPAPQGKRGRHLLAWLGLALALLGLVEIVLALSIAYLSGLLYGRLKTLELNELYKR